MVPLRIYSLTHADTTPVVYQMYKYSTDLLLLQFRPKIQRTESLGQQRRQLDTSSLLNTTSQVSTAKVLPLYYQAEFLSTRLLTSKLNWRNSQAKNRLN